MIVFISVSGLKTVCKNYFVYVRTANVLRRSGGTPNLVLFVSSKQFPFICIECKTLQVHFNLTLSNIPNVAVCVTILYKAKNMQ